MSWWKVAGAAAKGVNRASRDLGEAAGEASASRALNKIPRNVARRGYLIPGDPTPPAGSNLLDFRGLTTTSEAKSLSARGQGAAALGAVVDLNQSLPAGPFRLPVDHFYRHLAILAPPGMGKTYGIIAPLAVRLLRAGASVVLLDVTGDLPEQLSSFSRETPSNQAAKVASYHWSVHPNRGRHRWNPLDGLSPDDVVGIEGIKSAVMGDEPPDPKHRDFHDRDLRLFGGLLTLALHTEPRATLSHVAEIASSHSRLEDVASRAPAGLRYLVADLLEDESSGLWGLRNKLEPFLDPAVRRATEQSDFSLESISRQPSLLVVGAELELRQRSKMSSALLVNRLMAILQGQYGDQGRQPVVLVIDEAPEIAKRIDLAAILATARGARTGVVLAAQNATQFGDERESSSLLDNCDGMILLPGASKASLEIFKTRLGQREIERRSVGEDASGFKRNVRVERSTERIDLIGDRELLDPPFSRHAAFYHSRTLGTSPIALDMTRGVIRE